MADNVEDQEMEAEALSAIFDTSFKINKDNPPFEWSIRLLPVEGEEDDPSIEEQNHVGIVLLATIPPTYPEVLPDLKIGVLKGLSLEHQETLLSLANTEAENNAGMPAIFAICEVLREWLVENNKKGLDDVSMHAQMMRRQHEKEQQEKRNNRDFEAQQTEDVLTQAELEEQAVRKRREEGTPCTAEAFYEWKAAFEAEMEDNAEDNAPADQGRKQKEKIEDKSGRTTGFEQFRANGPGFAQAMEAEEQDFDGIDTEDVDEDLFDLDDEDDDLDDLLDDDDDEDEDPEI